MDKYKIMIMTASIGYGHDNAAMALKNKILKERTDDCCEVQIVDFMEILPSPMRSLIKSAYLKVIDFFPQWFHSIYNKTTGFTSQSKIKDMIAYKYQKKILFMLKQFQPDVILFTNPFPALVISYLKRTRKINTYTATMITDYSVHGIWLDYSIDNYFVASDWLKTELVQTGIHHSKIYVTGIPVDDKFSVLSDRTKTFRKLNLNLNDPVVMLMGGGQGLGPIEEIIDELVQIEKPLQLLVVAGTNEDLRKTLNKKTYPARHKISIFGFCNNINELMECAHLLISKPGGITMTEAVNKNLPVLMINPIPGHEVKNAQYFSKTGAAKLVNDTRDIKNIVNELLFANPHELKKMVKCCQKFQKVNAAEAIVDIIIHNLNHKKNSQDSCDKIIL